jgi:hypothetical protein
MILVLVYVCEKFILLTHAIRLANRLGGLFYLPGLILVRETSTALANSFNNILCGQVGTCFSNITKVEPTLPHRIFLTELVTGVCLI